MRSFIIKFSFCLCLFAGNQAYACSIAPSFLDGEFGSEGINLSDVSKQAHKILIGRFIEPDGQEPISFSVKKRIKPRLRFLSRKKIKAHFRDVPTNKVHLYHGEDERQFSSFSKLKKFTKQFRASPDTDGVIYGASGPIAGIFHGSDCERFVMLLKDQNYLIYLDAKNTVQASFPIKSISSDLVDGAATLFSAPPVSSKE